MIFAAGAYFTEGYWQAALIGAATVFLTLAVTEALTGYRDQLEKPIFYVTLLTVGIAVLIGTALYLGYSLLRVTKIEPFPAFTHGMIADFTGGSSGKPHTTLGTQCALISDSSQNMGSTISYKRVDHDKNGDGYLRVSFHLVSTTDDTPFAGIFCSFSYFPEVPYDVSYFHKLSFNIQSEDARPAYTVRAVLYSGTPSYDHKNYVMPSYAVDPAELADGWGHPVIAHFDDFHPARFFGSGAAFDPHKAYRVGFVIFGKPRTTIDGAIDLDNIAFVP